MKKKIYVPFEPNISLPEIDESAGRQFASIIKRIKAEYALSEYLRNSRITLYYTNKFAPHKYKIQMENLSEYLIEKGFKQNSSGVYCLDVTEGHRELLLVRCTFVNDHIEIIVQLGEPQSHIMSHANLDGFKIYDLEFLVGEMTQSVLREYHKEIMNRYTAVTSWPPKRNID